MPQINQLTAVDSVQSADQFPLYSSTNGDARKVSASVLRTFCQQNLTALDDKITQYSSPSATGFSTQVNNASSSVWLVLTPTGAFAAGTLVMPAVANCVDKQELLVNCTQAITALTVSGNGATITGAPTTLAANAFFRMRYNLSNTTWYRVG